ncbi:hypothetical protein PHYBLDRAFT_147233 [Phycomyces blakesleeanus NRRL 1555(-)]|uniref:Uncharacterized protein n=1 Tax=Phycomyces blakesleeanus (strain ATCC 8743b / DSM 1359 / FGSC 10004 / NBRC 33097 / NRRL 1555) TaxID=763407 RepID=A0A167M0Q5_PHYB8|nr:hypothetical protein PHYBLDRAFT_147233 [Phycomyces blakesleeanus NRRL 1555(-)]OAD71474.1 hypothetical protein PHYBLDRAFT_147233 [Phycomyces blakesleeanus NRRL 1555(-)]|eukprot:XP_018289514.1 hypothetical protein PHYBLDRAFT_147233 [Phycomyces blakesleeanus NRRL 1555(-)]
MLYSSNKAALNSFREFDLGHFASDSVINNSSGALYGAKVRAVRWLLQNMNTMFFLEHSPTIASGSSPPDQLHSQTITSPSFPCTLETKLWVTSQERNTYQALVHFTLLQ